MKDLINSIFGKTNKQIPTHHPDDTSQEKTLLRHFNSYYAITEEMAMDLYGIKRLSSRVSDLNNYFRDSHIPKKIECVRKSVINRMGKKTSVTDYYKLVDKNEND